MNDELDDFDALFDEIADQLALTGASTDSATDLDSSSGPVVDSHVAPTAELPIYDRLGGIVRQLHDSLRELGYDRSISEVVEQVCDSQSRLEYIATLAEQAANKVLNAVDEAMPEQESQALAANQLDGRWTAMFAGELSVDQFKQLARDSQAFARSTALSSNAEKERLLSIMMAQDFQDLTGQIIKKVVTLTQNLEQQLAQLLRDYAPIAPREVVVDLLAGPATPASALIQDDVDLLLSDLGF
jgi:chemotaxis protein CheZ